MLRSDGMLPVYAGIANDGCLYDSEGKYVDMNDGRQFLAKEAFNSIAEGSSHWN